MRRTLFAKRLGPSTTTTLPRREVAFSRAPPPDVSAPRCAMTGDRFPRPLEAQLLRHARLTGLTSFFWMTEAARRDSGLELRSAQEVPFLPLCALGPGPVPAVVNAAFVEETDLFFFLVRRPLPAPSVSHGAHWVYAGGQWRTVAESHASFLWMTKLRTFVSQMLRNARPAVASSQQDGPTPAVHPMGKIETHMQTLIVPPDTTNRRQAEFFWIDHFAVLLHGLALFTDAVWLPLNAVPVHPACMYNLDQIKMPC